MSALRRQWLVACGLLLVAGLTGCESLQRKFTRKPKTAGARPSPIINFLDYSRTITPLDRYRKHYLMFEYWSDELVDALQDTSLNAKRYKRASEEAMVELKTIRDLVTDDVAVRFEPLIQERVEFHRRFLSGLFSASEAQMAVRQLEAQAREIHRQFLWRDMEAHLKPMESSQSENSTASPATP